MERRVFGRIGVVVGLLMLATLAALAGPCANGASDDGAPAADVPTSSDDADATSRRRKRQADPSIDPTAEVPIDEADVVARHGVRVVRTDGSPVAGARLALHVHWLRFAEAEEFPEAPPPEWSGTTDGEGRATIPFATWERGMLLVSGPGIASIARRLHGVGSGQVQTIVAPEPLDARLRLLAPDGTPLAGVIAEVSPLVSTQGGDADRFASLPGPVVEGIADDSGNVQIDGLEAGWKNLAVRFGDATPRRIGRIQLPLAGPLTFVVPVACIVHGQVTERDTGRPLSGARVLLVGPDFSGLESILAEAACDGRGRYSARVLGVTAQVDRVIVRAKGHGLHVADPLRSLTRGNPLASSAHVRLDLQAVPTATVRGSVRSSAALPPGCVVYVRALQEDRDDDSPDPQLFGWVRVRADGGFEVLDVPVGAANVAVYPPLAGSFAPRNTGPWARLRAFHASYELLAEQTVDVPIEGITVAFEVPPTDTTPYTSRGFVRDTDGAPVPGAMIVPMTTTPLEPRASVRSAADGSFAIEFPDGSDGTALAVDAPGFVRTSYLIDDEEKADGTPIEILLERARRVTGRVVDPHGNPLRGARVQIVDGKSIEANRKSEGHTDLDGRFELPLDEVDEELFVRTDAPAWAPCWTALPAPPDEGPIDVGTIELGTGRTLRGTVVDATTGEALPDARIGWFDVRRGRDSVLDDEEWNQEFAAAGGVPTHAATDRQGRFVLPCLPDRGVAIVVSAAGYALSARFVPVTEQTLRIELRRLRTVHGRARRSDGGSLRGVEVYLGVPGSEISGLRDDWEVLDDSGRFRFEQLPVSAYQLKIWGDPDRGLNVVPLVVDVPASHDGPLDVVVEIGRELTGVVVDAGGSPLAGAHVEARSRTEPWSEAWTETDTEGRFRLASLDGSVHVLGARTDTHAPTWRTDITPGGDPVRLVLHEGGEITGVTLYPLSQGIPEMIVDAFPSFGPDDLRRLVTFRTRVETDGEGAFRLRGLADLPYRIEAGETAWHEEHGKFKAPEPAEHRPGAHVRIVYTKDEE